MTLNIRVLSPNRVVWDSEVKEIILSTNSDQIGVLPNHASLVAAVDIGVMKIRLNGRWSTMALMGGFTKIDNDKITVLVNNAERDVDINLKEAQENFRIAKADLARAEGKRQAIEADVALKRARTRLEAINASPPVSNENFRE